MHLFKVFLCLLALTLFGHAQTDASKIAPDDFRALTVRGFLSDIKTGDLKNAFRRISNNPPAKRKSFDQFARYVQGDSALGEITNFHLLSAHTVRGAGIVKVQTTNRSGKTGNIQFELRQPERDDTGEGEGWEIVGISSVTKFPKSE